MKTNIPCTVIEAGPCVVTKSEPLVLTGTKLQLVSMTKNEKHSSVGHFGTVAKKSR
jgi:hypothetical protein